MRFKIFLLLILINFIPLYAIIPIELEGDFESETEYIKNRNDYALKFFSNVAEPKWNDTTALQNRINQFLKFPQNEELFSASYLEYHKSKSTLSPFITSLFAGWTLGFVIANGFDLQDQNLLIPAAFSIGYGSYFSIYAKGIEFEQAKKNEFPRTPINNCLSFKFLDQNWKCEFEEDLPLQIAQIPQKIAEVKVINTSILAQIDSSDTTNPIIDSTQFVAKISPELPQITPPKINLEESKKWMHLLNSNNPDFKSKSQNALYKMNFVLQNIKQKDSSQLTKNSTLLDSLYNHVQNYDLKIPYTEEESKFWIKQLGPNFIERSEEVNRIYEMKNFLDSNRIPSEIYNKRTFFNSERSSRGWQLLKLLTAIDGSIVTLAALANAPTLSLALSIPTGLSYYGIAKDIQFAKQKELEQSKWRTFYNEHRNDHPKGNVTPPSQQELDLFK